MPDYSFAGAGMPIEIDYPEAAITVADFNEGAEQIRSFREPIKRAIQGVIAPSFQTNFDVGGRPAWEPLSAARIRQKGHSQILVDTGRLRAVAGQLNIWHIEGGYLSEDSTAIAWIEDLRDAEYGAIHQTGAPANNLPARPWAILQDNDIDDIQDVFESYINQRIGRTILRGATE